MGVGHIKVRGQARSAGIGKSCELMYKGGKWFVSLTLACADIDVKRQRTGDVAMAADWGVSRLLTIMRTDGARGLIREDIDNPRWFQSAKDKSQMLARSISAKKRYSQNWRKACANNARFKAKLARKRHDYQHQLSAEIAANSAIFATEKLTVKNMSASAAGTVEEPGRNVAQKSGLNREILDTAPAALFQKIAYKVLETDGQFMEAPTRKLKPSQTCPECGVQLKKALSERHHNCKECGYENDPDAASALVVLKWALGTLPQLYKEKNTKVLGQELPEAA